MGRFLYQKRPLHLTTRGACGAARGNFLPSSGIMRVALETVAAAWCGDICRPIHEGRLRLTSAVLSCRDCGAIQGRPSDAEYDVLRCGDCDGTLERRTGRSLAVSLALSATTLVLLIPANLLPFLSTSVLEATRQSYLAFECDGDVARGLAGCSRSPSVCFHRLAAVRFTLLTPSCCSSTASRGCAGRAASFAGATALQIGRWWTSSCSAFGLRMRGCRRPSIRRSASAPTASSARRSPRCSRGRRSTRTRSGSASGRPTMRRRPGRRRLLRRLRNGHAASRARCRCPRCDARIHRRIPDALSASIALTLAGMLLYIPANLYADRPDTDRPEA